jgi:methionyl aminopeptidase
VITYKSKDEIELMRQSNLLVGKAIAEVAKVIKPGITTIYLNSVAEKFIRDNGGVPSFLNYRGFPFSSCISVNDAVVHGFPR